MIRVTIQVAVSHGYLADGDSKVVMRQKISELMKTMPVNPETGQRPCPMTSCRVRLFFLCKKSRRIQKQRGTLRSTVRTA